MIGESYICFKHRVKCDDCPVCSSEEITRIAEQLATTGTQLIVAVETLKITADSIHPFKDICKDALAKIEEIGRKG